MSQVVVIPPEMRAEINSYSGYFNPRSRYAGRNLKGLFQTQENITYLTTQIYSLLTNPLYVSRNLPNSSNDYRDTASVGYRNPERGASAGQDSSSAFGNLSGGNRKQVVMRLIEGFKANYSLLRDVMPDLVQDYRLPYPDELAVANPVDQLSRTNLIFSQETARGYIQVPNTLIANAQQINPDTGKAELGESDYSAESYSDGTWHPEHLFTNKARNRNNNYWTPIEVNFQSDPAGTGPGHRYTRDAYHNNRHGNGRYQNEQFPRWQYSVNDRPVERSQVYVSEAQNGDQDRRTQGTRGFDMSALAKKSTY